MLDEVSLLETEGKEGRKVNPAIWGLQLVPTKQRPPVWRGGGSHSGPAFLVLPGTPVVCTSSGEGLAAAAPSVTRGLPGRPGQGQGLAAVIFAGRNALQRNLRGPIQHGCRQQTGVPGTWGRVQSALSPVSSFPTS